MTELKQSPFEQARPGSRGGRSPQTSRQETSGRLKLFIKRSSQNSHVVHSNPFYLLKDLPEKAEVSGHNNLISYYELTHTYTKYSGKKVKDQLSTFLPSLPGDIDKPGMENSTLQSVIDKPPIGGKELVPFSSTALAAFRLHPGAPLTDQISRFRSPPKKKKKKNKVKDVDNPAREGTPDRPMPKKDPSSKEDKNKNKPSKPKKKKKKKEKGTE